MLNLISDFYLFNICALIFKIIEIVVAYNNYSFFDGHAKVTSKNVCLVWFAKTF